MQKHLAASHHAVIHLIIDLSRCANTKTSRSIWCNISIESRPSQTIAKSIMVTLHTSPRRLQSAESAPQDRSARPDLGIHNLSQPCNQAGRRSVILGTFGAQKLLPPNRCNKTPVNDISLIDFPDLASCSIIDASSHRSSCVCASVERLCFRSPDPSFPLPAPAPPARSAQSKGLQSNQCWQSTPASSRPFIAEPRGPPNHRWELLTGKESI